MTISSGKRVALNKLTLTRRSIEAMKPRDNPWVAWDDKLVGFGVRVQPSGVKSFFVNYRTGEGGRKAPNRNVVIGRFGRMAPEQARRLAQQVLGKVAAGGDPARERTEARAMPMLKQAFEDYMASNPNRSASTDTKYRGDFGSHLGDWQLRPLDAITRQDVEALFNRLTGDLGWSAANRAVSLLRAVYRRPCVDFEGLRNPVDLWIAGGGRYHRPKRRKISAPAEVLPCWKKGIEAAVGMASARDALWFGLYTGMRIDEVLTLRCERVDMAALVFRVEETKTGEPLELPVTRQLAAILERRSVARETMLGQLRDWVFPSPASGSGRIPHLSHLYPPISEAGGAKFWFHGMRNCFITVAGARPVAAAEPEQAAGQPRPVQRRHRGICRRLDCRATPRTRAAHRGPDRLFNVWVRRRGGCCAIDSRTGIRTNLTFARYPAQQDSPVSIAMTRGP